MIRVWRYFVLGFTTTYPYRVNALLAAIIAVLSAGLMSSCGGPSSAAPDLGAGLSGAALSPAAAPAQPAGMPALPAPSSIKRDASLIETGLAVHGASFRTDLTHQHVVIGGDVGTFNPTFLTGQNPLYSQVALAIYSFDISSVTDEDLALLDLDLDGSPDLLIGTAHVFAGIPSLSLDKWDWTELTKSPGTAGPSSFSWGMSNPGQLRTKAYNGVLNVVIVVYGDTALHVSRVAWENPDGLQPLGGDVVFHKGWDGTIKGRTAFDGSVHVVGDGAGVLHVSYYDSSNGQLYYLRVQNRVVTTKAVDCNDDVGLFNDLALDAAGGLLLPMYDALSKKGYDYYMAKSDMAAMIWSPRSNFDSGDAGGGLPADDVGRHCSVIFDPAINMLHIFYEDATSNRIKHASRLNGLPPGDPWLTEFVSPPGDDAHKPVAMLCADGACCLYIVDTDSDPLTDNSLVLARFGASGWDPQVIATDCRGGVTSAGPNVGFCDGSVHGTEMAVCWTKGGGASVGKAGRFSIAAAVPVMIREADYNPNPGSGMFAKLQMMGDGSVRIADYSPQTRTVYFSTGDIPTQPQFSTVIDSRLAVGEDCDDLDFWVEPGDVDGDGFHDAAIVTLTSSVSALTGSGKKDFKGHVTLLK